MKVSLGSLLLLCGFVGVHEASGNDGIYLTPNEPTPLCPEVVSFTCEIVNQASTVLRWSHDGGISISDLDYVYDGNDVIPFWVDDVMEVQSDGFLNLTITNAMHDGTLTNFTAILLVDMEVLFGVGYRSLECGNVNERTNFTFMELDIEDPPSFVLANVDLIYDPISSTSFKEMNIRTTRPIYSTDKCQYRENSFINITFSLDGSPVSSTTAPISRSTNLSTCSISLCSITVPEPPVSDRVSLAAVNRFSETASSPPGKDFIDASSISSYFNFSILYTDQCETQVECSVLQGPPIPNCIVCYGTDPSYRDQIVAGDEPFTLDENTLYYVEVVFTVFSNVTDVSYHWRTTYMTEENACKKAQQTVIISVVVPVGILVLAVIVLVCVIVAVVVYRRSSGPLSAESGGVATDTSTEINLTSVDNPPEEKTRHFDPYKSYEDKPPEKTVPDSNDPYKIEVDEDHLNLGETLEERIEKDELKKLATSEEHQYEDINL